jgi:hypothetical protein
MVRRFVGATFSAGSSTSTTELRLDRVGVLAPDRAIKRFGRSGVGVAGVGERSGMSLDAGLHYVGPMPHDSPIRKVRESCRGGTGCQVIEKVFCALPQLLAPHQAEFEPARRAWRDRKDGLAGLPGRPAPEDRDGHTNGA